MFTRERDKFIKDIDRTSRRVTTLRKGVTKVLEEVGKMDIFRHFLFFELRETLTQRHRLAFTKELAGAGDVW
jgi:hypothetical protein